MKREYFLMTLFFGLVAVTVYLFYRILLPFLTPICWAAVFVIVFYPLYIKIERWIKSPGLRALIVTALIVILIISPAVYMGIALVQEAIGMFESFTAWVDAGKLDQIFNFKDSPIYAVIQEKLSNYIDLSQFDPKVIIANGLKSISGIALSQATAVLTNAGKFLFQFWLMIFLMFFLFRDGHALFEQIKAVIPMSPDKTDYTVTHLRHIIESTMYGGVVVSLLQGFLGGMMFWILGLPSPIFWGAVMAFLAFLPIIGPFIIYIPAGLILIFTGAPVKGIILIVVGAVVVSQIDNFLRPLWVSGKTGMHTMVLFVSIMGGVSMFGLLGVVLGPFVAAVFISLYEVFRLKMAESEAGVEAAENESASTEESTPRASE